jgi:hypothetical protein
MRSLITLLFIISILVLLGLAFFAPDSGFNTPVRLIALVLLVVMLVDRVTGLFRPSRATKIPPSQIAEMERLYFRSMREMLNEDANVAQVINDLQRILSIDPLYKNSRHYLSRALALKSDGENTAAKHRMPSKTSAEFIQLQEQLIDPDPNIRKSVVMELIQYGEDAVDPLTALLMDEDSDVRVHAATALGWVGGEDAVMPLMVALQDSNQYVRRYAARAMCWVVNESAIEGLIDALKDEDSYVRQYAARALGWSGDKRAIRPLIDLLSIEENNDVREYVLTALEDLGERNVQVDRPVPAEMME